MEKLKKELQVLVDTYIEIVNSGHQSIQYTGEKEFDKKIMMMKAVEIQTLMKVVKDLTKILGRNK